MRVIDKHRLNLIPSITLIVVMGCYLYFLGLRNGIVAMNGSMYGNNILLFYFNAFVGIFMCYLICSILPQNLNGLKQIGNSTMTILGTHTFVCVAMKTFFVYFFHVDLRHFPLICSFAIVVISLALGVFINRLFERKMPIVIGK